jgi:hypothetical protein
MVERTGRSSDVGRTLHQAGAEQSRAEQSRAEQSQRWQRPASSGLQVGGSSDKRPRGHFSESSVVARLPAQGGFW